MCEACKQTALQARILIEAIDQNRAALAAVLDKIHRDMGEALVVHRDNQGQEQPVHVEQNPIGQVLLVNYLAAFLAGEFPQDGDVSDTVLQFYDRGFEHGAAYAGARYFQLH